MMRTGTSRRPTRLLAGLMSGVGALTTPLRPADFVDLVDPLWSAAVPRGRVVEVRPETRRATTLRIRPGRGWAGHRAGQYVRVGVEVDGVRHWRSYSLTSPESSPDGCISITVQALPGGTVSPVLAHRTPIGAVLHLEPAAGDFILPDRPGRLLMLTGGSGITPVMAMLRTLAARDALDDVVLLHSAPSPAETIFDGDLRTLARRPGLRLVVRHSDTEGLLQLTELERVCPDWVDRESFVCGPAGLLDDTERHWAAAGLAGRMRQERFTTPRLGGGAGGTVHYGGAATRSAGAALGTEVAVDGATSLLEAGEAVGVPMPSGCRMGICFGCVLPLRAGQVRDLRTGRVHGEPGDLVQTCISGASGPARIDTTTQGDSR